MIYARRSGARTKKIKMIKIDGVGSLDYLVNDIKGGGAVKILVVFQIHVSAIVLIRIIKFDV